MGRLMRTPRRSKAVQASEPAARPSSRIWSALVPAALLLTVLAVNVADMPGMFMSGDPSIWREETRSMLADGHLSVDASLASAAGEPGQYFVLNAADGKWYSKYGIMNSLMSAPPMLAQRIMNGPIPPGGFKPDLLVYNLYNVLLSLLVCALLYRITGLYSARPAARALFVLAALYTGFLWYYQRAQSSELYQVLFFLGFYDCLVRFLAAARAPEGSTAGRVRFALGAWLMVLALVLTRVLYGLLIPVFFGAFLFALSELDADARRRAVGRSLRLLLVPPAIILAAVALVNRAKFGSVWLTGYHQWRPQDHLPIGPLWDGLHGFLFSKQYSIFLNFPILIFALLSLRTFVRKHRADAAVLGFTFLAFLLVLSKIPTWRGEWTYGPRYLLFLLPVLSLPFLLLIDALLEAPRRASAWAAAAAIAMGLGYSTFLQTRANRLDFFAYYRMREPLRNNLSASMREYFYERPMALICDDLISHRADLEELPFMPELKRVLPPAIIQDYTGELQAVLAQGNLYWRTPPKGD